MKTTINLMSKLYHLVLKPHSSKNSLYHIFLNAFKYTTFLICSLALPFLLNGCSQEQPIKIGFIGGLTGRVADLGVSGRNGALLAIEQRNNSGGINGTPIHFIAVDDKQDKNTAVREFNSLVAQGMEAIIGHMTSSMSVATVPLANKAPIVLMSPTATTTFLSDIDDYFLRVCATTDTYAKEMARYLRKTKKLTEVAVVYDLKNKAYTQSWINHFNNEFIYIFLNIY